MYISDKQQICSHSCVGEDNPQHYFVATQDKALRVALGNLPGGASVFVNVNGVQLEQPSEAQKRAVKKVAPAPCRIQRYFGQEFYQMPLGLALMMVE